MHVFWGVEKGVLRCVCRGVKEGEGVLWDEGEKEKGKESEWLCLSCIEIEKNKNLV